MWLHRENICNVSYFSVGNLQLTGMIERSGRMASLHQSKKYHGLTVRFTKQLREVSIHLSTSNTCKRLRHANINPLMLRLMHSLLSESEDLGLSAGYMRASFQAPENLALHFPSACTART